MSEIKRAGHFSVSVDSTSDVSNVDQFTCVNRYVLCALTAYYAAYCTATDDEAINFPGSTWN